MLKFKSLAISAIVVFSWAQTQCFAVEGDSSHAKEKETPAAESSSGRQENAFSKYDALKERIESLASKASSEAAKPELLEAVEGQSRKVKIMPSKQQFSDGAKTIERVKWYREQIASSCEASDKSSKLLGEFIDRCLIGPVIFDSIQAKSGQAETTTFELDAKEVRFCRDDLNAYFKAKKERVGEENWKKYIYDQEINEKLTKFYNWYGASVEGLASEASTEPSPMVKEVSMVENIQNLCLVENRKPIAQGAETNRTPPPPAQPSQQFGPPQVQNPATQVPQQPQNGQPQGNPSYPQLQPNGGYNAGNYGANYNPSNCKNGQGIGYRCDYDPVDYSPRYERDSFGSYLPLMSYPKGNGGGGYVPSPSSPAYFPQRQAPPPPPVQSGFAAPFLGRGLSLGFGFSQGYPYGGYPMMPYGPMMGGYGGGIGYSPIGIGGGYVSTMPAIIEPPLTPCSSGLMGSCGGCGGGLMTSCGGGCGGGLITPINQCFGNNPINPLMNTFMNPFGMNPNRMVNPRMPYNPWNPYGPVINPYYSTNPYNPWRVTIPRVPGTPYQPVAPVNPGGPGNPGYPGNPLVNTVNNPVSNNPVRVVVPRTN